MEREPDGARVAILAIAALNLGFGLYPSFGAAAIWLATSALGFAYVALRGIYK